MASPRCLVCSMMTMSDVTEDRALSVRRYPCPKCGTYEADFAAAPYVGEFALGSVERAVLSYAIRRMSRGGRELPLIHTEKVKEILANTSLPDPLEQIDNFVVWLAENVRPGSYEDAEDEVHQAVLGAEAPNGVEWAVRNLHEAGLLLKDD